MVELLSPLRSQTSALFSALKWLTAGRHGRPGLLELLKNLLVFECRHISQIPVKCKNVLLGKKNKQTNKRTSICLSQCACFRHLGFLHKNTPGGSLACFSVSPYKQPGMNVVLPIVFA